MFLREIKQPAVKWEEGLCWWVMVQR